MDGPTGIMYSLRISLFKLYIYIAGIHLDLDRLKALRLVLTEQLSALVGKYGVSYSVTSKSSDATRTSPM